MVPDPSERIDATKKTGVNRKKQLNHGSNGSYTHIIPPGFRFNNSGRNLEHKLSLLQQGGELDVFIHPEIGGSYLGQGDYSDAVTGVLERVYEFGVGIAGGRKRQASINAVTEFIEACNSKPVSEGFSLYLAINAIQLFKEKDRLLFEKSPVEVFLYKRNNLTHNLGRYFDHDKRHRMVAEVKYLPLGSTNSANTKTTVATEIGRIKIYREN